MASKKKTTTRKSTQAKGPRKPDPDLVPLSQIDKVKKVTKASKPRGLSAIDAAVKVLGESKEPLSCPQMIQAMADRGYWSSPNGKTPAATLSSAIQREINTRGKEARFRKTDRGLFSLAGKGA
jgi:hypothetical protein